MLCPWRLRISSEYGEPTSEQPWGEAHRSPREVAGFRQLYFLDRAFWKALLIQHPEGMIVAVPKRGGLLYAPISDTKAVEGLKRDVSALYSNT